MFLFLDVLLISGCFSWAETNMKDKKKQKVQSENLIGKAIGFMGLVYVYDNFNFLCRLLVYEIS